MQVELSAEAAALVQKWIELGFGSPEEVIEAALISLGGPKDISAEELERLLAEAADRAEREGWIPVEDSIAKARALIEDHQAKERRSA